MSSRPQSRRSLRIGLLGGTFDPIHNGHLALARAAAGRYRLDLVYFIPCGRPPHKDRPGLSPFLHRFAMVTLACAGDSRFLPSLLEAGPDLSGRRRIYSIQTVRRVRRRVGERARLFFLLGADAFLYLPTWKGFRELIRVCDFIVADRPGFPLPRARSAFPGRLAAHSRIHFLRGVRADVSASRIRRAARRGGGVKAWVPPRVADYIAKMRLYRRGR